MEQPPGYVAQGQNMVCKLKKVIYGLKQSHRASFEKFNPKVGFHRCAVNYSVFIKRSNSGNVILAVYVDDILITNNDTSGIAETK